MKTQIFGTWNFSKARLQHIYISVFWSIMVQVASSAVIYHKPNSGHLTSVTATNSGENLSISFGPTNSELSISLAVTGSPATSDDSEGRTWTSYQYQLWASLVTPGSNGSFGIGYLYATQQHSVGHFPIPYTSGQLIDGNLDNWLPNWTTSSTSGFYASPFTVGSLYFDIGSFWEAPNEFIFSDFYGMLSFDYANTNIDFGEQSSWPDSFYPIRFILGENFHYGYARFSFFAKFESDSVTTGLILHDWAYETTPNTPIAAGAVPEPTAPFVFGVCSIFFLVVRRRGA